MHKSILLALWLSISFIFYKIVASIINSRRHAAAARRLSCQPAHRISSFDPLGLRVILRMLKADKEQRIPQFFQVRLDEVSNAQGRVVSTISQSLMGADAFFTVDPKNIQAVLATQFKDFGLGETRNKNFFPLLGRGIVSLLLRLSVSTTHAGLYTAVAHSQTVFLRRRRVGTCTKLATTSIRPRPGQ